MCHDMLKLFQVDYIAILCRRIWELREGNPPHILVHSPRWSEVVHRRFKFFMLCLQKKMTRTPSLLEAALSTVTLSKTSTMPRRSLVKVPSRGQLTKRRRIAWWPAFAAVILLACWELQAKEDSKFRVNHDHDVDDRDFRVVRVSEVRSEGLFGGSGGRPPSSSPNPEIQMEKFRPAILKAPGPSAGVSSFLPSRY